MDLLQILLGFEMDRRAGVRRDVMIARAGGWQLAEFALHQFQDFFVRNIAGGTDHQMIRRKPIFKSRSQSFAIEFFYRVGGAENRPPQRVSGPKITRENFMQHGLGIVEIHFYFFEDDLAFLLDVFGVEFGAQYQVGDDVEGDGQMLVEDLGAKTDLFFRGEGIQHAADGIHFAGDGFGGAALRTFEDHVFHEMRQTVFFGNFAAGTVADPYADGDGADVRHRLGDDYESVGQNVLLNIARFCRHEMIVTHGRVNCHARARKGKTV